MSFNYKIVVFYINIMTASKFNANVNDKNGSDLDEFNRIPGTSGRNGNKKKKLHVNKVDKYKVCYNHWFDLISARICGDFDF